MDKPISLLHTRSQKSWIKIPKIIHLQQLVQVFHWLFSIKNFQIQHILELKQPFSAYYKLVAKRYFQKY